MRVGLILFTTLLACGPLTSRNNDKDNDRNHEDTVTRKISDGLSLENYDVSKFCVGIEDFLVMYEDSAPDGLSMEIIESDCNRHLVTARILSKDKALLVQAGQTFPNLERLAIEFSTDEGVTYSNLSGDDLADFHDSLTFLSSTFQEFVGEAARVSKYYGMTKGEFVSAWQERARNLGVKLQTSSGPYALKLLLKSDADEPTGLVEFIEEPPFEIFGCQALECLNDNEVSTRFSIVFDQLVLRRRVQIGSAEVNQITIRLDNPR